MWCGIVWYVACCLSKKILNILLFYLIIFVLLFFVYLIVDCLIITLLYVVCYCYYWYNLMILFNVFRFFPVFMSCVVWCGNMVYVKNEWSYMVCIMWCDVYSVDVRWVVMLCVLCYVCFLLFYGIVCCVVVCYVALCCV